MLAFLVLCGMLYGGAQLVKGETRPTELDPERRSLMRLADVWYNNRLREMEEAINKRSDERIARIKDPELKRQWTQERQRAEEESQAKRERPSERVTRLVDAWKRFSEEKLAEAEVGDEKNRPPNSDEESSSRGSSVGGDSSKADPSKGGKTSGPGDADPTPEEETPPPPAGETDPSATGGDSSPEEESPPSGGEEPPPNAEGERETGKRFRDTFGGFFRGRARFNAPPKGAPGWQQDPPRYYATPVGDPPPSQGAGRPSEDGPVDAEWSDYEPPGITTGQRRLAAAPAPEPETPQPHTNAATNTEHQEEDPMAGGLAPRNSAPAPRQPGSAPSRPQGGAPAARGTAVRAAQGLPEEAKVAYQEQCLRSMSEAVEGMIRTLENNKAHHAAMGAGSDYTILYSRLSDELRRIKAGFDAGAEEWAKDRAVVGEALFTRIGAADRRDAY